MIQTTITFDVKDQDIVTKAVHKLDDDLSLKIDCDKPGIIILRGIGHLHMEVAIDRLKHYTPGVSLQIFPPEVVFKQPMMQVCVKAPVEFRREVTNELLIRNPDKGEIKTCGNSVDVDMVFEGRFPLYLLHNLAKRFYTIGSCQIKMHMVPDGTSDITEDQLRDMLKIWEL